jgi:hypothetical protein
MDDEAVIAGYRALAKFLTEKGFTISHSSLAKYCSPAIDVGPSREGTWGRLPVFKPSRALAWARNRVRTTVRALPAKASTSVSTEA